MIAREPNSGDPQDRFVILEHDHPFLHWDLLMQDGDVLKAWRLLANVTLNSWIRAEVIADHRVEYLDYEGPVSGDRGTVARVASGHFIEKETRISGEREFEFFECELAAKAVCRHDESSQPQWYFE